MNENTTVMAGRDLDRRFFLACAIWFTVTSIIAFLPATVLRIVAPEQLGGPHHPSLVFHGAVASAWVLLYLVQTLMIRTKRISLHRKLGLFGAGLLVLVLYSGVHIVLWKWLNGQSSQSQAALNTMQFVVGFLLVAAGLWYRKTAFIHKRLIMGGTVMLTVASPSRTLGLLEMASSGEIAIHSYLRVAIIGLPLIALILYDTRVYRRPYIALIPAFAFVLVNVVYIHRPLLTHPEGEAFLRAIGPIFLP